MRIGIYSYFGFPLSFEERLDLIRAAGFRFTGIGLGAEEDLVRTGESRRMVDLARERGLEVEYVHAPEGMCNDLWSGEGARGAEAISAYRAGVDYCRAHGVGILVIHLSKSKGGQPEGPNRHGLEALGDLAKRAEDSGVKLAVENTQKDEFVDYVLEALESPCVGLCYDSSHDFLYGGEPGRLLGRWGERLMTTHIGDNDGEYDRHWLPGQGRIAWDVVRAYFPVGTYEGCLNLEVFPKVARAGSAAAFLARARRSIEKLDGFLTGREAAYR